MSLSTGDCSYVPFFDVYFPSSINCASKFVHDVSNVPSPVIELFGVVLNRSIPANPVMEVDVSV